MFYTFRNQTIFFQAEHGIRDKLVTGVQTCALPICRRRVLPSGGWLCAWTSFGAPATGRRRSTACPPRDRSRLGRSEEHTSELQSLAYLVCRLLLEKKKKNQVYVQAIIRPRPLLSHD